MQKKKTLRRIAIGSIIVALITANIVMWSAHIDTLSPYAITSGDDVVCCVRGRDTAGKVLSDVFGDLAKEDTSIAAVSADYEIEKGGGADILSEEEARDAVIKYAKSKGADITVVSGTTATESYTPAPEYLQNAEMMAGESDLISEGTDGEKEVALTYTTVNGKTKGKDKTDLEILKAGIPAVIMKGLLGLPSGESWEEYDGDPVANNGNDIITTAKQYLGVRYVWGGKDLNRGVDCSGFVIALYRKYGLNLTYPLYKHGTAVSYSEAQPGDLLYFPGHYGLYIGNGQMIHASSSAGRVVIGNVGGRKILAVRRLVDSNR